jgi:hypothetical protein
MRTIFYILGAVAVSTVGIVSSSGLVVELHTGQSTTFLVLWAGVFIVCCIAFLHWCTRPAIRKEDEWSVAPMAFTATGLERLHN